LKKKKKRRQKKKKGVTKGDKLNPLFREKKRREGAIERKTTSASD